MGLYLKIVSPARTEFSGEVESVTVPGTMGEFQMLVGHAPLISSLEKGTVKFCDAEGEHQLQITSGFLEIHKNQVSLCVELEDSDAL